MHVSAADSQNMDILTHQLVHSCCPEHPECPHLPQALLGGYSRSPSFIEQLRG